MDRDKYRMTRKFGTWSVAVFLLAVSAVALGIGATPRYIEELRIGGGYGESIDGGTDFEQDGDILTDGDLSVGGAVTTSSLSTNDLTVSGNYIHVENTDAWHGYESTPGRSADAIFRFDISGTSSGDSGVFNGFIGYSNYTETAVAKGGMLQFSVTWYCDSTPTRTVKHSYFDLTSDALARIRVHEYETDKFEVQFVGTGWYHRYSVHCWYKSSEDPDFSVFGDAPATGGSDVAMSGGIFLSDDGMVKFGDSQDFQLRYEYDSGHYFKIEDGSGNDMLTVMDGGTTGDVAVTGNATLGGTLKYVNSGAVTLDGMNPTLVDFTDEGGVDMPDTTYAVLLGAESTVSPITATWANRSTTGFEIWAWNVSTGNPSTSGSRNVSWMVVDQ